MRIENKLSALSAVRYLTIAESHHSVFGVGVAREKSAGSRKIPGFFYINATAPANRKKDAPLRALGGRIVTLVETQLSAIQEKSMFCFNQVRTLN